MKVIFVHGRSQQEKDPIQLQADWTAALEVGCKEVGKPVQGKLDVSFPYYGDILFEEVEAASRDSFQALVSKGAAAAAPVDIQEQEFIGDLVLETARQQGITEDQIANEANTVVEKGVLNWPAVLAALRLLNEIPGVASASVELFTRDVWCYLTKKGARLAVHEVVDKQIPKVEPCIVVAHSLGSIVAYNVLMNRVDRSNVLLFMTLGSPLGIKAISTRLPSDIKPRKAPEGIPEWFNARDSRDTVALFEIVADTYLGSPVVENYSDVLNSSENRHGIVQYLHDKWVAAVIAKHL